MTIFDSWQDWIAPAYILAVAIGCCVVAYVARENPDAMSLEDLTRRVASSPAEKNKYAIELARRWQAEASPRNEWESSPPPLKAEPRAEQVDPDPVIV